jgi:hypothetical protein
MGLLEKLSTDGTLSLRGGKPANFGVNPVPPNSLHNLYSVDGNPDVTWRLINRNLPMKPQPSSMDELDPIAPNLSPVGVVSQVYKSKTGRRYRDLGPVDGRY